MAITGPNLDVDVADVGGTTALKGALPVLHGFWLPGSSVAAFWMEMRDDGAAADARASVSDHPPDHPRQASFALLQELLPAPLELYPEERTAYLPTAEGRPLPSGSPLPAGVECKPWTLMTGETIVENLIDGMDNPLTAMSSLFDAGDSVIFWESWIRFAADLFAAGGYLPGVLHLESRTYPAWQAALRDDEEARWRRMSDRMPAVCSALYDPRDTCPAPGEFTLTFLDACIDSLVRKHQLAASLGSAVTRRKKDSQSIQRQWVGALKGGHFSWLCGTPERINHFAVSVRDWQEGLRPGACGSAWRLGFELKEPATASGSWSLLLTMVSLRDPTRRVLATSLCGVSPSEIPVEARRRMLEDLGQAAARFEPLYRMCAVPFTGTCELNRAEAMMFLIEAQPVLATMGFSSELPSWWTAPIHSPGLTLKIETAPASSGDSTSRLGMNQMVKFDWALAVGDQELSEEEFRAMVEDKPRVVFAGNRWHSVDPDQLEKSLSVLEDGGLSGSSDLAHVLQTGAELARQDAVPVFSLTCAGDFCPGLNGLQEVATEALDMVPDRFNGVLRVYQERGVRWLDRLQRMGFGACLADDMGLGKTVQIIALLNANYEAWKADGPTLIICPMSVVGNWVHELNRFAPFLSVTVHHGVGRLSPAAFRQAAAEHDVVVSTYNLLVRDQISFMGLKWAALILDEAQTIKTPATKQASAARALPAKRRFCLTGTPVENRLTELWSIMEFLNAGYLGSISTFRAQFAIPIERDNDTGREDLLRKLVNPFILRRLKTDPRVIQDLPEKLEQKVYCNLAPEQAVLYQAVVDRMLDYIDDTSGIRRRSMVLSALMKLKQISNHPAHFLRDGSPFESSRSGKLQRLEEMLEEILMRREKALIFSQFSEFGRLLYVWLAKRFGQEVLFLHGGTPKAARDEMIERFQTDDGPPLFILSLKAGGLGLNLTAATNVFHYDRWWNPAVEDQATDRSYRIGQDKNVFVYKFVATGTIEEKIDKMLEDKKELASRIVAEGESSLAALAPETLSQLFTLARDAVVQA